MQFRPTPELIEGYFSQDSYANGNILVSLEVLNEDESGYEARARFSSNVEHKFADGEFVCLEGSRHLLRQFVAMGYFENTNRVVSCYWVRNSWQGQDVVNVPIYRVTDKFKAEVDKVPALPSTS